MSATPLKNSSIPVFDLTAQYHFIKDEIDTTLARVLESSAFINGPDNERFEFFFGKFCKVKHCIGVSSGSAALELALEALGIGPGDEVICPAHTFAASAESIVHRGAKPVFIDIDENTYNLDPNLIKPLITPKTKTILAVHLYGQMADMAPILKIAKKHKLQVIEDAAQAHGAMYQNQPAGSMGDIGIFSFFPAKNLGCYGDGGAVVTNNKYLAERVRLLKDHGRVSKYEHQIIGYGERLDNLQAAVLLVKLKHLKKWNTRRRQIAKQYDRALSSALITPFIHLDCQSVYYVYTLRHPKRHLIQKVLSDNGVKTGIYYPKPLHLQPSFSYLGYKKGDLPITEKIAREIFSIPIYPELSNEQVDFISGLIKDIVPSPNL